MQGLGQHRAAVLAVEVDADLTQPSAEAVALSRHERTPGRLISVDVIVVPMGRRLL
jgi:hypothetical protein